jgi:hypothetical protein
MFMECDITFQFYLRSDKSKGTFTKTGMPIRAPFERNLRNAYRSEQPLEQKCGENAYYTFSESLCVTR